MSNFKKSILVLVPCMLLAFGGLIANKSNNTTAGIDVQPVANWQWNTENGLPYQQGNDINYGFSEMEVMNNKSVAFLIPFEQKIKIFDYTTATPTLVKSISLNFRPLVMAYSNNMLYVANQNQPEIQVLTLEGKLLRTISFNSQLANLRNVFVKNNNVYVQAANGSSVLVETNDKSINPQNFYMGMPITAKTFAKTIANKQNNSYTVQLFDDNNRLLTENTYTTALPIGAAILLGADNNYVYVDVQQIETETPLKVKREIAAIKYNSNSLQNKTQNVVVPNVYYIYTPLNLCVNSELGLYHAITAPNSTQLFKLNANTLKNNNYPEQLTNNPYHFNEHLLETGEEK